MIKLENTSKMIAKVKSIVFSNSHTLKNMSWLTVLQFANYLVPLLIIPYIVRVLGAETFGKVSYAQNIISYFTLIINFGFDYSATRQIALNKNNRQRRESIFWFVIKQKTILFLACLLALSILYFGFDKVRNDFTLYLFVFLLNIGIVLFPVWFFQGMEDMRTMAIFSMLVRSSGMLFTLFFVKNKDHYLLYPLLITIGYIICGFISILYVINHYKIGKFKWKDSTELNISKESIPVFLNTLFASLYTAANLTILGFYYNNFTIGLFGAVQKIIVAIMMLTSTPVHMAIFPKLSREFEDSKIKGIYSFNKTLKGVIIYGLLISLITFSVAKPLVNIFLGDEFTSVIPLMKILSILPLLVIVASLFTIQGLYGAGLQKYAPYIGAILGTFSISFNLIFVPKYGIYGASWAWIISEILEISLAAGFFYWKIKKK